MRAPTDSERTAIAEAWAANARRDWGEALGRWTEIRSRYPDNPAGPLGAAAAWRGLGRLDEASAILGKGVARFTDHAGLAIAQAWIFNARRDWASAIAGWGTLIDRFGDDPKVYLGAAAAHAGAHQADRATEMLDGAEAALSRSRAAGMDPGIALGIELEIAKARYDWSAVLRTAQAIVARADVPRANILLAEAQAHWHLGDGNAADAAAERALAIDPALSEAVVVRASVATDRGDGPAALDLHRQLAQLNPNIARWSLKVVQLLNWFGLRDEAAAELERVRKRWPADPMVAVFVRNFGPIADRTPGSVPDEELRLLEAQAPALHTLLRPPLVDDPMRDVVVAALPGAITGALVFTGGNDAMSIPLELFDRYLAAHGVSAVYVKDFGRLRFLNGVRSLGSYEASVAALRALIDDLGVQRLVAIGNCDGGMAAVRYGVELGAARILAFGAPTGGEGDAPDVLQQARNFMVARLAASVPEDRRDLRRFLEDRDFPGQIELVYAADKPRDARDAGRLADLPNVALREVPGPCPHGALARLALDGDLGTLIAGLVAPGA